LGWSNADEQPLSFGSRKEHSVSIYLPLQKIATKTKRFVLGDFIRFCQKVIFVFSPRSRRKLKNWTHGALTGDYHT